MVNYLLTVVFVVISLLVHFDFLISKHDSLDILILAGIFYIVERLDKMYYDITKVSDETLEALSSFISPSELNKICKENKIPYSKKKLRQLKGYKIKAEKRS